MKRTPVPFRTEARRQVAGFSLVEMLVAAFIMAVGLLGLATLQMMSIRTAGVGTRLTAGVQLAERILECASAEATQSYLGAKSGVAPTASALYVPGVPIPPQYFHGDLAAGTNGDPDNVYTANVVVSNLGTFALGGMYQIDVAVQFNESVTGGTPLTRTVRLSRQVTHG